MKYLVLVLLLFSCGGKKDLIRDGAVLTSKTEIKVERDCAMIGAKINLNRDLKDIDYAIRDLFDEVTIDLDYNYTQDQVLHIANFLDNLGHELAKLRAKHNNAYILTAACKDGYDYRKAESYGKLKKLLGDDPLFKELETKGLRVMTVEEKQELQVKLYRAGIGVKK